MALKRWGWIWILAALVQLYLPGILFPKEEDPYDVFLVVTHHKTGTALAGCVFGSMVEVLDAVGDTRLLYAYENRVTDTSSIFFKFLQSQQIAIGRPSLIFSTGSPMPRKCIDGDLVDLASVKQAMTNASMDSIPRICDISMCPCYGKRGSCITSSNRCFTTLPPLRYRGAHFIRDPLDIVVSAYKYHLKGTESWLFSTTMRKTLGNLEASGVPKKYLEGLEEYAEMSYFDTLKQLPPEEGVILEGIRSLPDLYSMAQEHLQWQSVDWMMTVRFEDMKNKFFQTVGAILKHGRFSHTWQGHHVASSVISRCDVWSWDSSKLRLMDHTTFDKKPANEKDLYAEVLRHPFLKRHICKLSEQLGYEHEQCKPATAPSLDHSRHAGQTKLIRNSPLGRHSHLHASTHTQAHEGMHK